MKGKVLTPTWPYYGFNNSIFLAEVPLDDFLASGHPFLVYKLRWQVFAAKGYDCVVSDCTFTGDRVIFWVDDRGPMRLFWTEDLIAAWNWLTTPPISGLHCDLAATDADGNVMMMTMDHIIPRSKKGGSEIENIQPMCFHHNALKKDKIQ